MARFLVSWLAGGLVVAGAWFGWTHTAEVDAAVAGPAGFVELGPTPEGEPLRTAGTEVGFACSGPTPRDAAGMDDLMGELDRQPRLEGADHGASIELADGRRMYTYGDTIRADGIRPFMVRNSVLISNGDCVRPMPTEHDGPAIPSDGKQGYWPMSMRARAVEGGTVVEVITATVSVRGTDSFETSGSNLATFEVPTGRMPRLVSHEPLGERTSDPRVPTWGAAMWDDGPWTYVFGTSSNADKSTAGWALHVARTRPEELGSLDEWEYWDGSSWVEGDPGAAQSEAAQLIGSSSGVSHVLSVIERDGSWYAISKEGDYHGVWLSVWKAPSITGPYTKHRVRPLANDGKIRRYAPLAHPDVEIDSDRLLVSWSEAPTTHGPFYTHPELYRPKFAEIDLP